MRAGRGGGPCIFRKRIEWTPSGCEPYWKDGAVVDVYFTSPLNLTDVRDATFEALLMCQRLLPDWTIKGPTRYEGDQ
jgi:hypothetical protein